MSWKIFRLWSLLQDKKALATMQHKYFHELHCFTHKNLVKKIIMTNINHTLSLRKSSNIVHKIMNYDYEYVKFNKRVFRYLGCPRAPPPPSHATTLVLTSMMGILAAKSIDHEGLT